MFHTALSAIVLFQSRADRRRDRPSGDRPSRRNAGGVVGRRPELGPTVVLISVALTVLALAVPVALKQTLDGHRMPAAGNATVWLFSALALAVGLESFLRWARSHLAAQGGARIGYLAGCHVVEHLLRGDLLTVEREPHDAHLDTVHAVETAAGFEATEARLAMVDTAFVPLLLTGVYMVAGDLALIPLLAVMLLLLAGCRFRGMVAGVLSAVGAAESQRAHFLRPLVDGLETIGALAMAPLMLRRYERRSADVLDAVRRQVRLTSAARDLAGGILGIAIIVLAVLAARRLNTGELTLGGVLACLLLAVRAILPVCRLAVGVATGTLTVDIGRHPISETTASSSSAGRALPVKASGLIELKEVSLADPGTGSMLFSGLNVVASPGERIAICGAPGAGKSLLLLLMIGAVRPAAGDVLIDGHNISRFSPQALRRRIVLLPSRPALFAGTVNDNLVLFDREDRLAIGREMAHALGLDWEISRLADGYETRIEDGSDPMITDDLRCGIALARALALEPKVLLLDDADAWPLALLKKALAALDRHTTLIMVAARPEALALMDRAYTLNGGRLEVKQAARSEPTAALTAVASECDPFRWQGALRRSG